MDLPWQVSNLRAYAEKRERRVRGCKWWPINHHRLRNPLAPEFIYFALPLMISSDAYACFSPISSACLAELYFLRVLIGERTSDFAKNEHAWNFFPPTAVLIGVFAKYT